MDCQTGKRRGFVTGIFSDNSERDILTLDSKYFKRLGVYYHAG
jgi:hypothetical protein